MRMTTINEMFVGETLFRRLDAMAPSAAASNKSCIVPPQINIYDEYQSFGSLRSEL
jgi:hypothetical protein